MTGREAKTRPALLLLVALVCGGASVRARDGRGKGPLEDAQDQEAHKPSGKGHVVSVKGPCDDRPCCKPISVTLPPKLEPKTFSPRIGIKLMVAPDGSVWKVKTTRSSGIEDVDRQLREGARRWCMEKTKEGHEVDFLVNLDVR